MHFSNLLACNMPVNMVDDLKMQVLVKFMSALGVVGCGSRFG